jgi:NAD(P)-dependent dehydrogenase (short-subunit alcohol dehydrogenase family)
VVSRVPREIEGSVVVVSGASSSIGRAAARLFAENGAWCSPRGAKGACGRPQKSARRPALGRSSSLRT